MIEKIEIDNFRLFKHLEVPNFSQFNLIVGKNTSGKTSLIESVFLMHGPLNPSLPKTIDAIRGLDRFRFDPEDMWGSIFYGYNIDNPVSLKATFSDKRIADLKFQFESPEKSELEIIKQSNLGSEQSTTYSSSNEMHFIQSYKDSNGIEARTESWIENGEEPKIQTKGDKNTQMLPAIYLGQNGLIPKDLPIKYSELAKKDRHRELIKPMQLMCPELKDITILMSGKVPIIYVDCGIRRKIPLSLLGGGAIRLLSILINIKSYTGGTVLIDEIENGFHHTVLSKIWNAIVVESIKEKCQVFATTHSFSCIKEFNRALTKSKVEGQVIRVETDSAGSKTINYLHDEISTAIDQDIEVR